MVLQAVHDVSFEVEAGQVFGYIGPNGAGKTTSMRILATLDLPDYGDAPDRWLFMRQRSRSSSPRAGSFMLDNFGTYANMNCISISIFLPGRMAF
ncbi:MAG: ATP-binding cassette domain-containing protein [Pirellulaceae bacterium]